jgi:hypothetical protein
LTGVRHGSSTSSGIQTKLTPAAPAKGGKKKVSVKGLGSTKSSCKQTMLRFASA